MKEKLAVIGKFQVSFCEPEPVSVPATIQIDGIELSTQVLVPRVFFAQDDVMPQEMRRRSQPQAIALPMVSTGTSVPQI